MMVSIARDRKPGLRMWTSSVSQWTSMAGLCDHPPQGGSRQTEWHPHLSWPLSRKENSQYVWMNAGPDVGGFALRSTV